MNAGRLVVLGWKVIPRLPGAVGRALFESVAVVAWLVRGQGVRRLERNLARVRPDASRRELRGLSLAGMRSYMRYYCESFQLPALSVAQVDARVRAVGVAAVRADLAEHRSAALALTHSGNWDLAGAWAARNLGPVVTVAERLEPPELFREFVAFRESLGITVVPFDKGAGVFRRLVVHAKRGAGVIPLLADRDLSSGGVEVDLAGHAARVAAGPAALAVAAGVPLYPTRIYYERLRGQRRRRAGGPWGIVIDFGDRLVRLAGVPREQQVAELTQAWVDAAVDRIRDHPQDWHMLQRVFVEDLDAARLAPPSAASAASGGTEASSDDEGPSPSEGAGRGVTGRGRAAG